MYANSITNEKVLAKPKSKAICPFCKEELISKCGHIKIWHWSHKKDNECDLWAERDSEWHLSWKTLVKKDCCEVKLGNHRADILNKKLIIELQNSFISPEEIIERENFYNRMIWLFNIIPFINHFVFKVKENYFTFRWKYPKRSLAYISKPLFFDFGDKILEVKKIYFSKYCGGWGRFYTKEEFKDYYLGGILK
jgi:competence CoiA-like predicted nuclease